MDTLQVREQHLDLLALAPRDGPGIGLGERFAVTTVKHLTTVESVVVDERIVAVGLLTRRDVEVLGSSFKRIWPVDETPCFSNLLLAIDDADRELRRERGKAENSDLKTE